MLTNLDSLGLDPPPIGTSRNIVGTKKVGKKLYRYCVCGLRFREAIKALPQNHNCKEWKIETLE